MKVTGGKYRNKQIEAMQERTLRPTTGRIREAVFNLLKHGKFLYDDDFIDDDNPDRIAQRRVVDVFCGTGAFGIESLSRDAEHVTFIDQNAKTLSLARRNVQKLGELGHAAFIRSDSTMLPPAPQPCMLAFIDPPYNRNLAMAALRSLEQNGWLARGALVVVEQGLKDEAPLTDHSRLMDSRVYDKTRLTILQYQA